MPSYIFRLPANTAGAPVSVYAGDGGGFTSSVASGNLDGSATFTATLPVGNYTARARSAIRDTFYTTGEELASPVDPDSLDQAALRAALVPFWAPGEVVAPGAVRVTALGLTITRNTAGTTGTSYDATEAAKWTVASGGGTVADATTTAKGIVELATTGETTTGTDTVRAVTPAGVKAATDALPAVARTGAYGDLTGKPTIPSPVDIGLAKDSGGARYSGLPGVQFSSVGTRAHSAGQLRYYLIDTRSTINLAAYRFEVTTGPTVDGNVRVGLYPADADWQPTTAAPIFDVGVPVATGFTGIKTGTISGTLPPGRYLLATAVDQAMTLRSLRGGVSPVISTMGVSPITEFVIAFTSYAPMPTPGPRWTGNAASNTGPSHSVMLEWSTPLA